MRVVIVGSRERQTEADKKNVTALLESLRVKYPGLLVLSCPCDRGIGAAVKRVCLDRKADFAFLEPAVNVYASLPQSMMMTIYKARDEVLYLLGEEFHFFPDVRQGGLLEDLRGKVEAAGIPFFVYPPGKDLTLPGNDDL